MMISKRSPSPCIAISNGSSTDRQHYTKSSIV